MQETKLMKKYNVLILTDHSNHSKENSVYAFANAFRDHRYTNRVEVATRGIPENDVFFNNLNSHKIWAAEVKKDFRFTTDGTLFRQGMGQVSLHDYDVIWLRLPPPVDNAFLDFLDQEFSRSFIINAPAAIYETGSKEFLMNFQHVCAPMKICRSIEDIDEFKKQFPIVLKPFREYGGKGIVRMDGEVVWSENKQMTFNEFTSTFDANSTAYLGVKFMKNVTKGDKRIVVVNGKIMGASLRLPAKDSWLCNVAMGGTSFIAEIDKEEYEIIETINPILSKMGIVMYGVDTLVGDNGKRVLSEINTTSIGGLPQIARQRKLPLVEEAVDLMWKYYFKRTKHDT